METSAEVEYCIKCKHGRCQAAFPGIWIYLGSKPEHSRVPVVDVMCPSCATHLPLAKRMAMLEAQPGLKLLSQ